MKIIHCVWSLNIGGTENMLVDIVNEQVKKHKVSLIVINDSYNASLLERISPAVNLIKLGRKPNSKSIFLLFKLNLIISKKHPDVIHLHNAALYKVILPWLGERQFLTIHALNISVEKVPRRIRLIAISDAVAENILKRCNRKSVVIPNGINVEAIDCKTNNNVGENFQIVQVGRLDVSTKGQDILIKAIGILRDREVFVHTDFIGDGASKNKLVSLVESLQLNDRITFKGAKDRTYIYKHLKEYNLLCQPSRFEGFGLTVAEGLAAKVPVLVSDEGGPYEIIQRGKFGISFKKDNPNDLADKIEGILKGDILLSDKTDNGFNFVREHFSLQKMVLRYVEEYKK